MKRFLIHRPHVALACAALLMSSAAPSALAQASAATEARATGKARSKAAAKTPADPNSKNSARKRARAAMAAAGATAAAAAAATALAPADEAQLQALGLTHLGDHACEFARRIQVLTHPSQPGYVQFNVDRRWITAKPVLSHTGALRLEDVRGQYLLLQIAFKSMLMDVKSGQRLADECLHDRHHEARAAAAAAPPTPGLGIAPPRE